MNEVREHLETLYGDVDELLEGVNMDGKEFMLGLFYGMSISVEQLMNMFPELMEDEEE